MAIRQQLFDMGTLTFLQLTYFLICLFSTGTYASTSTVVEEE